MEKYILHLLTDILYATENVSLPFAEKELNFCDWISEEEEDRTAAVRGLEEWTGISKEQLPPVELLSDKQVKLLLDALKKMLHVYNWSFVLPIPVPERIQYAVLRDNFDQDIKVKQWHMGFFEHCRPGTEHGKCAAGKYCQCAFYAELFKGVSYEDLTPDEERARELEIEIQHLQRKYRGDWMKYYPYHLDSSYDDEEGNPYNYDLGDFEIDDEDDEHWSLQ
jgi:hypothetical protein